MEQIHINSQFIHSSFDPRGLGGATYYTMPMYQQIYQQSPIVMVDQFSPADLSHARTTPMNNMQTIPTQLATTIPPIQQVIEYDEWKSRLHPEVARFLESMILDDKLLSSNELDRGCVEELCRSCEQSPEQTKRLLQTFKEALSKPNPYKGPINNPSAYLTKMLKNPSTGGRGGRGRGRGGDRGRGRARGPIENTEHANYCREVLKNVMGPKFEDLDHKALNYLYKQSKQMIDYIAEEWQNQNGEVNKPSNWVTKIITAKSHDKKIQEPQANVVSNPAPAGESSSSTEQEGEAPAAQSAAPTTPPPTPASQAGGEAAEQQ